MFSFGPIKTSTALGGGILSFRDRAVCTQVHQHMSSWPRQSRCRFAARLGKYSLLMLLLNRPVYALFVLACRALGMNHDRVIGGAARGFPGRDLMAQIRQRPSPPLLALLERRLRRFNPTGVAERIALARRAGTLMPGLARPGDGAPAHPHWLFPILHETPEPLMRHLWTKGLDATRGASSLCVVEPPAGRPDAVATQARHAMERLLFLPVYEGMSPRDIERLAHAVRDFAACRDAAPWEAWPDVPGDHPDAAGSPGPTVDRGR